MVHGRNDDMTEHRTQQQHTEYNMHSHHNTSTVPITDTRYRIYSLTMTVGQDL
jgi:hypothetical protein